VEDFWTRYTRMRRSWDMKHPAWELTIYKVPRLSGISRVSSAPQGTSPVSGSQA